MPVIAEVLYCGYSRGLGEAFGLGGKSFQGQTK